MHPPAEFLVLMDEVSRALLFDADRRLLGEVIDDDRFIVDQLLRTATPWSDAPSAMLDSVVPPPPPEARFRCFRLA